MGKSHTITHAFISKCSSETALKSVDIWQSYRQK